MIHWRAILRIWFMWRRKNPSTSYSLLLPYYQCQLMRSLRNGSGTLVEMVLMVQKFYNNQLRESETHIGPRGMPGSGVSRSDLHSNFKLRLLVRPWVKMP